MKKLHLLLILAAIGIFIYCSRSLEQDTPTYLNHQDSVQYVGMQTCRSCHTDIYETFIHTGMGKSFDRATPQKSAATYGEHALVYDEAHDFYYYPFFRDSILYVLEFRLENGDTTYKRLEQIHYIVGSGQHTNSHIVDFNGYIFQAPITFYTQDERWDLAPGFEDGGNLRFERALNSECITCHNHLPTLVEGSMNKYAEMPSGIECERCHGPGELHVRRTLAGEVVDTSTYIDYSIVNPRKLPRHLQMDLCQRCHLQGIAVLEDGKDFYDFKPGMELNEVMNVFLPRYTNSDERFIMASQADRLRQSPCYLQSDMTCITCHNPHHSVELTSDESYNETCRNCHQAQKPICSAPMAERQEAGDNCVACHMPTSGSTDIPHVHITDHYISKSNIRRAADSLQAEGKPGFLGLKILTKEEATPLEMAKGYLAMHDKYVHTQQMLDSAGHYLEQSKASDETLFKTRVHYLFARQDFQAITRIAVGRDTSTLQDGWTAYRIGQAYAEQNFPDRALAFYERATSLLPYQLDFQEKKGVALIGLRKPNEAREVYEWVLRENPKRAVALCNLGFTYALSGDLEKAEKLYDRALRLDPDYEQALLNKAAVRFFEKDEKAGRALIRQVLKINPENAQALQILEQLQ